MKYLLLHLRAEGITFLQSADPLANTDACFVSVNGFPPVASNGIYIHPDSGFYFESTRPIAGVLDWGLKLWREAFGDTAPTREVLAAMNRHNGFIQ